MLMSYNECLEKYGSKYLLKKQVSKGSLYRLEKGIYADGKYQPEYQIIAFKYPKAVFTMNSAFYYHGLTDVIPDKYYLATDHNAAKIADGRVIQVFENSDQLENGAEMIQYGNSKIHMYNRERMLVELLRNKNKIPFDYYKEILANYRKIANNLDIPSIQDMIMLMPKSRMIMEALQMEVF